jgi:hypothetical protein
MPHPILSAPTNNLNKSIIGVWWLLSREDWTKDGEKRIDPTLGANPIAIITYTTTHFAAQFMKRNREEFVNQPSHAGKNNTIALGGYDAYFGTYSVDEDSGKVSHTLIGSINPDNIGMTVVRDLRVNQNQLTIQLETTTSEGEPIIRTLIWGKLP